jgi:cell division protein FtsX
MHARWPSSGLAADQIGIVEFHSGKEKRTIVDRAQNIIQFREKDLSLEEAGALQLKLSQIRGVDKVEFISRTEAWRRFKEDFGTKLDLEELVAESPLPHTFNITVKSPRSFACRRAGDL